MWCRFLTFCVLVSFILFVVASCIYGRPSFHLFFHRCCGDDIENDQVIFENFGNNFLKERLVGGDIIEVDNETLFDNEDIGRISDETKEVLSINDPDVKKWIADTHISNSANSDTVTENKIAVEQTYDVIGENDKERGHKVTEEFEDATEIASDLLHTIIKHKTIFKKPDGSLNAQEKKTLRKDNGSYGLLEKESEKAIKSDKLTKNAKSREDRDFLNVHDKSHELIARTM